MKREERMLIDADDCRVVQLYSGGRVYITFRGNAFALDRRDREFIALIADTLSKYEEKSEEALEAALDEAMGDIASGPPESLVEPLKPQTITTGVDAGVDTRKSKSDAAARREALLAWLLDVDREVFPSVIHGECDAYTGYPLSAVTNDLAQLAKKSLVSNGQMGWFAIKSERPARSTKLTDEMARLMRERYSEGGISMAELGTSYGISQATVSQILTGATYKTSGGPLHVPNAVSVSAGTDEMEVVWRHDLHGPRPSADGLGSTLGGSATLGRFVP